MVVMKVLCKATTAEAARRSSNSWQVEQVSRRGKKD